MLSYRHAFHAGNHADVLKHAALSILLDHFRQKEKPFTCVDTHAGSGFYRLDSSPAQKTLEAQGGIVRLLAAATADPRAVPPPLAPYLDIAAKMAAGFQYPGSPELERRFCRAQDSLILCELHPAEIILLRENMSGDSRIHIHHRNGFEFLAGAALPARSCVLLDPSYETDADYPLVCESLQKAFKRNAAAVFAVWYPLLQRRAGETADMLRELASLGEREKNVRAELFFPQKPQGEYGLSGSGMLIINAPWKFAEKTAAALDFISRALGMEAAVMAGTI